MKTPVILLVILFALLTFSCEKEEQSPDELIVGKWIIYSTELLGVTEYGDGDYLQFDACSDDCNGIDFMSSDTTYGSFTYNLNTDGSILEITDTMSEGGNYNFTFDVLELSENDMRITAETLIFGNLLIVLSKN